MGSWSLKGSLVRSRDPLSHLEYRRGHRDALYLPLSGGGGGATESQKEIIYKREPDASNHENTPTSIFDLNGL